MPGTRPKMAMMDEVTNSAVGLPSCVPACSAMDSVVVTRVTTMAVASDSSKEGICATRPSPMVSSE